MSQIHERDKPTWYKIVNAKGEVIVSHASKSTVLVKRAKLQKERGEKLEIVLRDDND